MERRVLGGTGIWVSGFALGTMMLGAMGNPDHDESIRIIHTALDADINFVDTPMSFFGESQKKLLERPWSDGAMTSCSPPSSDFRLGRTQIGGAVTALDHPGTRSEPASPWHGLHRPLPTSSARLQHGPRRNARCPV